MKKQILLLAIAVLSLTFFSCTKDQVEEAAASVTTASMSAMVNDTTWTTITRVTKKFATPESFVITGTSTDQKVMVITIRGIEKGIYTTSVQLEDPSAQVGGAWRANSTNYVSNSGTVEISKLDVVNKKISGTFKFNLISQTDLVGFKVESGKFENLSYTESETDSSSSN